jgi:hypothetical protein
MCFIALFCEAHVTRALREKAERYRGRAAEDDVIDERQLSAVTALRELAEVRAVPVNLGNQKLWVRTDIEGYAAILFKRLGLRIPPRLLKTENVVAQTSADRVTAQTH